MKKSASKSALITRYKNEWFLTLSWRRSLSYRNQSTDLLCKSMDWFLYDNDLRHERVKQKLLPWLQVPFSSLDSRSLIIDVVILSLSHWDSFCTNQKLVLSCCYDLVWKEGYHDWQCQRLFAGLWRHHRQSCHCQLHLSFLWSL